MNKNITYCCLNCKTVLMYDTTHITVGILLRSAAYYECDDEKFHMVELNDKEYEIHKLLYFKD